MANELDYHICEFVISRLNDGKNYREWLAGTINHVQQILELQMTEKPKKYYIVGLDNKTYYGIVSLYGSSPSVYATTIKQEAILHYESDLPKITTLLNRMNIEHDYILYDK